ncbi:MAG TPA: DUF4097 family beta strand repeat-containing protein [Candidatus Limnocylindrales bacterium]
MTDSTRVATTVREVPLGPGGEVSINLTSSDLRLHAVDGDLVTIRTRGGEHVDDVILIDREPARVSVRDAERGFRLGPVSLGSHRSLALDIDVPRTAGITCRTLSGDVEADGMDGESRWSTASGDLRLAVAGGALTVDTMSGDLTVESSGPVGIRARTVSGDLRLHAPRVDALQVSTTSGDIRLDADLGAAFEHSVSSVSGDVHLETASPVRLETQTIAGDVRATGPHRAEGGRGRRMIVVGDGSVRVAVRTTSGDIRLGARGTSGVPATAPMPPVVPEPPLAPAAPAAPEPPAFDPPWLVAEAEAAPNLVRPDTDAGGASTGSEGVVDRREAARLDILRSLERGELDVEAATHRLVQLDEAAPRSFRGFC